MPGRRNPKWIALGIVALCLGGLLSYVIYARVATETPVVSVAQTVYRGEVIDAADLTTITLQGSTIRPGRPCRATSAPCRQAGGGRPRRRVGSGRFRGHRRDDPGGRPGRGGPQAVPGRTPTSLLLPSSAVRLVALSARANGERQAETGDTFTARVIDQANGADGTSILVNVDVAADQAPLIAQLAAQDRIALVRDAGR